MYVYLYMYVHSQSWHLWMCTPESILMIHQMSRGDMGAAGIGRAEGDLGQLAKMAYRPDAAQRWRRAKVLVIDEVCLPPSHSNNPHL